MLCYLDYLARTSMRGGSGNSDKVIRELARKNKEVSEPLCPAILVAYTSEADQLTSAQHTISTSEAVTSIARPLRHADDSLWFSVLERPVQHTSRLLHTMKDTGLQT